MANIPELKFDRAHYHAMLDTAFDETSVGGCVGITFMQMLWNERRDVRDIKIRTAVAALKDIAPYAWS